MLKHELIEFYLLFDSVAHKNRTKSVRPQNCFWLFGSLYTNPRWMCLDQITIAIVHLSRPTTNYDTSKKRFHWVRQEVLYLTIFGTDRLPDEKNLKKVCGNGDSQLFFSTVHYVNEHHSPYS